MDPNETLRQLRAKVNKVTRQLEISGTCDAFDVTDITELWQALDGWVSGGGFLPAHWGKAQEKNFT